MVHLCGLDLMMSHALLEFISHLADEGRKESDIVKEVRLTGLPNMRKQGRSETKQVGNGKLTETVCELFKYSGDLWWRNGESS